MKKKKNQCRARDKPIQPEAKDRNEDAERCSHCPHIRNYGGVLYCFLPRCQYEWTQDSENRK